MILSYTCDRILAPSRALTPSFPAIRFAQNVVGTAFVLVGTLRSNVVAITAPITYPGGASTPVVQWRLGLLYSGTACCFSEG